MTDFTLRSIEKCIKISDLVDSKSGLSICHFLEIDKKIYIPEKCMIQIDGVMCMGDTEFETLFENSDDVKVVFYNVDPHIFEPQGSKECPLFPEIDLISNGIKAIQCCTYMEVFLSKSGEYSCIVNYMYNHWQNGLQCDNFIIQEDEYMGCMYDVFNKL